MARQRVETKNLDIYGDKPIPWSRARRQLVAVTKGTPKSIKGSPWLATTGPGGRTHLTGIGALWVDDRFYFVSGPRTRKSRNVARYPQCAISMSLRDIDVVIEGKARRVTDEKALRRLARIYVAQGWPTRAENRALTAPYSAPSAGRPPWYLYVLTPETAFAVATAKPNGATRWTFKGARRSR
ncbi:MAG: hypothetical protein AUH85_11515 [Chloroflexi bacterium 13_1_40CM_4_68_4]|nr:MAG: hypothetical protein AUH85_11515 [Chloroflexi bacterium 13_1_40CM_4_68_4]